MTNYVSDDIDIEIYEVRELYASDFWRVSLNFYCSNCKRQLTGIHIKVGRNGARRIFGCTWCKAQREITISW